MAEEGKKRIFSGIQPSGVIHIGNYLGAIKQFTELQLQHEAFFCVVDQHAITVPQEPEQLYENTLSVAALYIASGINPKIANIFIQSHVPAHTELAWILNTITPIGELERMTQFKDKTQAQTKETGILAGLLNYPTLMAADILLYGTHAVPVGEDQTQHIELTRMLAQRFNNKYGETFVIPQALVQEHAARIMSLLDPAKKMSKSADSPKSYISMLDAPDEIRQKIKNAVTDSGNEVSYDKQKRPAISNLISIHRALTGAAFNKIGEQYKGKGYADFKQDLADIIIQELTPIQERYQALMENKKELEHILREGARNASAIAEKKLLEAKEKMGFYI
ncbi:MAG: tryptophan--tRNA ligase [Candidatus Niyogibacteria bacterium CG10_big_fil_rev_8_21_14_0_10_46_36]|uniref:Tryptophan--tRNA ligase n=1 Tax=Candidatus Niyogibacteria bacterium CG10_big_fil_rev_8_21_14_0_10_46_36 TaxID=1974726 RepID=A0A2H0TFW4_9BACT|nr:MAG: tryptophan--tRNA ligase [Candidatus Niyogibacteria bacterium CG10_big_fil_rev_8_21_14_0_10_46_36]